MAAEKNNKTLNVPNLRFPEFSGEWEKYSLNDISTIYGRIGFRGYTVADIVEKGEGAIALSPINIDSNCLTYEKDNTYISTYKYEESPEIKIFAGDIIFVKTGSTVGKVAFVDNIIDRTTLNPQLVVLKQVKCNPYFLYLLMAAPCFQKHIKRITVGGAVPTLSQNEMGRIRITLPPNAEQDRISALFKLLNYRIETQKKIIEDLKKLKDAISKRVFENHGSSNSMLLGMVADIYQPQTIPTSLLNDTLQYPVYGANGVIGKYSEYNHENSQICIACRGNTCGTVNYSKPKSWITGNAMVINTDKYDVNKRFLFHQLCTVNYSPLISGSGQPQIVRAPLEKMKIWFPNEDIQERIATLFDTIEDRALIEETTLILAERMKQYLLNQMFI